MYRTTKFEVDLRPGGKWRSEGPGQEGSSFTVRGEYLEVDPPRVLVHTWVASWTGELKTTVRWELSPSAGGTHIEIRHSGFARAPAAARDHGLGWQRVVAWMQAYVERQETVDSRPAVAK